MGRGGVMLLWRLSDDRFADVFDGGYGLSYNGRWNTVGRPVTYAASSPALCLLEKLVHIEDPDLLPPLVMVAYEIPATVPRSQRTLSDLPHDWRDRETLTQDLGDRWMDEGREALLFVPSVIVPIERSNDANVIINHRHPACNDIAIAFREPFVIDLRLQRSSEVPS